MLPTITRAFPPLPLEELTAEISRFSSRSLVEKHDLIKRLVMLHPILSVDWNGRHLCRARKLSDNEALPGNVDGVIWRKDAPASQGRANPYGFPVIYLADHPDTALREVRAENHQVVLASFEILLNKSCMIAPVGELMCAQRTGRGSLLGNSSQYVTDLINSCEANEMKSLLITDAFLLDCLADGQDNYAISSYVAKCIFDKLPAISAISYPSQVQSGAICFALRTENFWEKWGVKAVRCGQARHLSHGYYHFSRIRHVIGIMKNGNFRWGEQEENVDSMTLLEPLWIPS
ncbi:RES domain-containing protein [Chromobacterium amazonense]|uniref:RES domain-containing protein n=1 Tax=Chromobacterium amazonense TaxID=1382803 RepID=A0ABU8UWF8_9NEIS|nr:RES domain-containing protein [Chromobacterium amazonense]MDQ4542554.1 RES domain-containing protein [Chromobacterium amazonense]